MKTVSVMCFVAAVFARAALGDVVSQTLSASIDIYTPRTSQLPDNPFAFPQWSPTMDFAQFDSALGTLTGIAVTVQARQSTLCFMANGHPTHLSTTLQCVVTFDWSASIMQDSAVIAQDAVSPGPRTITMVALPWATTRVQTVQPGGVSIDTVTNVDAVDFAAYSGAGTVPFALNFNAAFTYTLSSNFEGSSLWFLLRSQAAITVDYTYSPVPAPGAVAVLGFGGLIAALRRR